MTNEPDPALPPFIADQRLLRLDAPPEQQRACLRPGAFPEHSLTAEELKRFNRERMPINCSWHFVLDRTTLFADRSIQRMCITIDAGIGKTYALRQIEYLRHTASADPASLVEQGHLVIRLPFSELPTDYLQYVARHACVENGQFLARYVFRQLDSQQIARPANIDETDRWLNTLLARGQVSLLVDALDQTNYRDAYQPDARATALREFCRRFPKVRLVVAGRPYAVDTLWGELFDNAEIQWQFIVLQSLTPTQVERYLGTERYSSVRLLEADALATPRTLRYLRKLRPTAVATLRSASDVYWQSLNATFDEDVDDQEYMAETNHLDKKRIWFVLALIAHQMTRRQICGEVGSELADTGQPVALNQGQVDDFLMSLFTNYTELLRAKRFSDVNSLTDFVASIVRLNRWFNVGIVRHDFSMLRFENLTLQHFFAALWMSCWASEQDRAEWQDRIYRGAGTGTDRYREFWVMLCGMPAFRDATIAEMPDGTHGATWASSIAYLFHVDTKKDSLWRRLTRRLQRLFPTLLSNVATSRQLEIRPTELMYRAWPVLLRRAKFLKIPSWNESNLHDATLEAQAEARRLVPLPMTCDEQVAPQRNGLPYPSDEHSANTIVLRFLTEFPCLYHSRHSQKQLVRSFHHGFRAVPPDGTTDMRCYFSNESLFGSNTEVPKDLRSIDGRFLLHAHPLTNELADLFDSRRRSRFSDYSGKKCPAIYLTWYDSWCLATWFHGYLPSELEWEYACRADPGGHKGPVDFWWSEKGESFENAAPRITRYTWTSQNSGNTTHPVGATGHANSFGLSDMLGNAWEWTSTWYFDDSLLGLDPRQASTSRVLRGGSFNLDAYFARCSRRVRGVPAFSDDFRGCRVARASSRKS